MLKVLYVDDDRDLRDVAELSLQLDEDMDVRIAESGAAVLALVDEGSFRPDVFLLDVMMPAMDGPALLAALQAREDHRETPIIFVTARTQSKETSGYLALGACGVITKPFDPLTLAPEVRRLIGARV